MRAFHLQASGRFRRNPTSGPSAGFRESSGAWARKVFPPSISVGACRNRSPFSPSPLSRATVFLLAVGGWLLAAPAPGDAQWPGEIHGTVVDATTGTPLRGASVTVLGGGRSARSDGSGEFRLRSLDPGEHEITVKAPGYRRITRTVQVQNGMVSEVLLELPVRALELEGLEVEGHREERAGVERLDRATIERSGARTAGELLGALPGVTVRSEGPGGRATVSLRGSGADAVLVLVDGIPLNDPVTGEADLSTLSAAAVEEIRVLPGARSARYGPRAQGGAVLVETRGPSGQVSQRLWSGSLGRWGGEGSAGGEWNGFDLGGSAEWSEQSGEFSFRRPEEVGGGDRTRENADQRRRSLGLAFSGDLAGGDLRSRLRWEELRRGLPGKSFAPSRTARQNTVRGRGSATWDRSFPGGGFRAALSGTVQEVEHRDPDPPFGTAYDDRTRMAHASLRTELERSTDWGDRELRGGAGLEVDHQNVAASALADGAPTVRTDLGGWAEAAVRAPGLFASPTLSATGRLHRDGISGQGTFSHDLTATLGSGNASLHLAHRSAFSPPTLGDQFFQEGVAVAPNPELKAQRIPSEWELGASGHATVAGLGISTRLALFRGDVRGMIVWSPDFRFVWSPRNVDVKRRGLDARVEVEHPASGLRASGSFGHARVIYARGGGRSGSQVVYRPRNTGSARVGWEAAPGWEAGVEAQFLGTRYPVPSGVNALPSFWSFDLNLRGRFQVGDWTVDPALRVDRLLDGRESFIFAFPEPGRTWEVQVRVRSPGQESPVTPDRDQVAPRSDG